MATIKKKKKAVTSKTAKTSKKKQAVAKKKASAKSRSVSKKKSLSKKETKAKRKISKKARSKKKAGAVSKLSKEEKAARRRKLNAYRRHLQSKRESLLQAYNISKSNTRIESRDGTEDYIDYAVSSYHRDFTLSLTEMDRQQLKLVEEALARLRKREYGNCMHCSSIIPEKRLEVEPWARHCIRCQELEEQGLLVQPEFEQDKEEEEMLEEEPDDDEDDEAVAQPGEEANAGSDDSGGGEDFTEKGEDDIDL